MSWQENSRCRCCVPARTALPFPPIVASGPNSASPHHVPGDRALQSGDLLILDWGATASGYISDLTRTFFLAPLDPELERIHQLVLRANAAARAAVHPGAACASVDQAARSVITAEGHGSEFRHRTGHGIGMEAHEPPYIRDDNAQLLQPGMTFTVEPGVYLTGRGGVRIEDNVLVTPGGCECLILAARVSCRKLGRSRPGLRRRFLWEGCGDLTPAHCVCPTCCPSDNQGAVDDWFSAICRHGRRLKTGPGVALRPAGNNGELGRPGHPPPIRAAPGGTPSP